MSILSETIKRLDDEKAGIQSPASSQEAAADLLFVAGVRKRWPAHMLLVSIAVAVAAALYFFLWQPRVPDAGKVIGETNSIVAAPEAAPVSAPAPASVSIPAAFEMASAPAAAPVNTSGVAVSVPSQSPETASHAASAADEHERRALPIWYEAGWTVARLGKWQEAFDVWEEGVRSLPRDRMVIMSNSYADLSYFAVALDGYIDKFPALGIRQRDVNGQLIYRLLVFPHDGNTRGVFPEVQALFSRAWLVNASLIQDQLITPGLSNGE